MLVACNATKKIPSPSQNDDLVRLQTIMTGSFTSGAQAAADSSYYNISLHMYPVWKGVDTAWLYVEQAIFENQAKPYRQRMYALHKISNGIYKSDVYTIDDPESVIGQWENPNYFDNINRNNITKKEGCAVYLKEIEKGVFEGSTEGKSCSSTLRGASYATSVVQIKKGEIKSWDQGFNTADEQVWGATKGGYIFQKN